MKKQISRTTSVLLLVLPLLALAAGARAVEPITGDAFYLLVASQDNELQRFLDGIVAEEDGYMVTGPLDVIDEVPGEANDLLHMVRLVCRDDAAYTLAIARLRGRDEVTSIRRYDQQPPATPPGFRGAIARIRIHGAERGVLVQTLAQARWLIWYRDAATMAPSVAVTDAFARYAEAVSRWLIDHDSDGKGTGGAPSAPEHGLDARIDLFPPEPPYVIDGYENYLAYLDAHREIHTGFARRIVAFVPTDSLREEWATAPPDMAWPSKAPGKLQRDYAQFLERGGDTGRMLTLTPAVLSQLGPGEYMFAVGASGRIRFAARPRLLEVRRLENEGEMIPRAVHGFLFPGEPLLSAGMFTVSGEDQPAIAAVNTRSGHFFYCNTVNTIYDDVAIRSDGYLLTLGHFFRALERMGIRSDGIVVSKF